MSTKTPTGSYYAVRRGKNGLTRCLFVDFQDALPFLDEEAGEYHVFDALDDATAYLQAAPSSSAAAVPVGLEEAPLNAQMLASIAAVMQDKDNKGPDEQAPLALAPPVQPPPAKKRRTETFVPPASTDGGAHRAPTKKWEEYFQLLKESLENGFTDAAIQKLDKWMKDQRYAYKLYQQGKSSSMTVEKIRRLRGINFQLPEVECLASVKPESYKEKRGIYKRWYDHRDALKAYMETHDGSWQISKDDAENAKLKSWIETQQQEYKKFVNNQESNMNQEKVKLLRDIGFSFAYISFDQRLEQLRCFKKEDGHLQIPPTQKELIKWMASIRRQCKAFIESGQPTRDINAGRYTQLVALGLDDVMLGKSAAAGASSQDETAKWETMYAKLQEYKCAHGDVNGIKRTPETRELCNWIVTQRNEYKKLQQSKPSKMTAARLIRFNEIGFLFSKRGNYKTFDDRLEQLKEFKAQHGHLNIPIAHPELGEFVGRQRAHYNKMMAGEKCSMTPERVAALQELGFVFEVGGSKRNRVTTNKTWDERFAEIQAFKQEFGHALVPQHSQFTPGIGAWVKDQRKYYKNMLAGKKSPMTAEKALKLTSVGFVWDCFERSKRRRRGEMEEV